MAFTRETLSDTQKLLEAGRKTDAERQLRKTVGLSSPESRKLLRLMEQELAEESHRTNAPYIATPMDGPLKTGVASMVLGKGKRIEAIEYIKSHRKINLPDCVAMIEQVEKEFAAQYRNHAHTNKQFRRFSRILLIPLAIGIAFSAFSAYLLYTQFEIIATSDRVMGQVIDMHYQYKGGSAPIIAFDWEGQTRTHQSSIHSRNPVYSIDEEVPLYVNREDPSEVIIDTFVDRWSVPGILGLIGGVALLLTLFIAWFNMRR